MAKEVDRLQSEANVLPMGIDDNTGFCVSPGKEVIEAAIKDGVGWLSGRRTWWNIVIKLVAIVT